MRIERLIFLPVVVVLLYMVSHRQAAAQVENVPAEHPVYEYLHRMEVKRILPKFNRTVAPVSRRRIAGYLRDVMVRADELSTVERNLLNLYRIEFAHDLDDGRARATDLFGEGGLYGGLSDLFTFKQRYLYQWQDTSGNALFINGIVSAEIRSRSGDEQANLTMAEAGGRIRGTLGGKVGFFLDGLNGKTWGDRPFALEDQRLLTNSNYRLIGNDYYDESNGYIRFDTGWFGLQIGRERLLWRENYGRSLILSSHPPTFDFVRFDASYGAVNYNFIHGWIMGPRELISFDPDLPPLPYNAQKYFVAHRLEFSVFRNVLQIGINETLIYARESPELGYLNPVSFLITTERNLGDRDKLMIGIDFAVRPLRNVEISFGGLFDDLNFEESFSTFPGNRWAVHGGIYLVDPLGIPNLDVMADYTRIEPYFYAHQRSPDRYYAHTDFLIGHPLGPNSDDTTIRMIYKPHWQWRLSFEFQRERHGDNIVDEEGNIVRNVGGDFLMPHRRIDPREKKFLDGVLRTNYYYRGDVRFEVLRQIYIGGRVEFASLSNEFTGEKRNNLILSGGFWLEM
jgi:hypothetical protein